MTRRSSLVATSLLCFVAGCAAAKPVPAPTPDAGPPPVAKPPPFRRSDAGEFHAVTRRPQTSLLSRNATSAEISGDGRTVVMITRRGGVKIFGPSSPRGTTLAVRDVENTRLSPDATRVATIDDEHVLTVFNVLDGKPISTMLDVEDIRFISPTRARVYANCQLAEIEIPSVAGATPTTPNATSLGSRQCGEVSSSDDGSTWVVAEIAGNFPGAGSAYKNLFVSTAPGWAPTKVMHASENQPFTDIALANRGDKLCALKADGNLSWTPTTGGEPEELEARDVIAPLAFDSAGEQMLYGVESDSGVREVRMVDFRGRILRAVTATTQRRWGFLPGGLSFVAYGDRGADLFDMAAGTVQSVVSRRLETDSFAAVPENTRRFLLGQERRRSLDLYWIELP